MQCLQCHLQVSNGYLLHDVMFGYLMPYIHKTLLRVAGVVPRGVLQALLLALHPYGWYMMLETGDVAIMEYRQPW